MSRAHRPWLASATANVLHPERQYVRRVRSDELLCAAHDSLRPAAVGPSIGDWLFVEQVIWASRRLATLSSADLLKRADDVRLQLLRQGLARHNIIRTFAIVRDSCRRHLGFGHHRVQILGGRKILDGRVAEMATGEGKTITALLPAATAALAGIRVHVITVNDYLAERDASQLRSIYNALGLSVGLVIHGQSPTDRAAAYGCDIVYGTNKEITFDYLRDRIALRGADSPARALTRRLVEERAGDPLLLRGLEFAIVDEADSILIDEARTPLVISGLGDNDHTKALCETALEIASSLRVDVDFALVRTARRADLTAEGRRHVGLQTGTFEGVWRAKRAREELVEQALSALYLHEKDVEYIVSDGKIQIVDEATGRVMEDRQWERGLHQMIEVKEACDVSARNSPIAQITFQRFFQRYLWFGGMSGTAAEVGRELRRVYDIGVVRIPTNRRIIRRTLGTKLFATQDLKWANVIEAARREVERGRAVLIGTRSVAASEALARRLKESGIEHVVLNARSDRDEAGIVAKAGRPGSITVATNMAGRGTDIGLEPAVRTAGGLHVILTEFHESRRIDRQLFGRSGRQGDPGSVESIVSLEDELFLTYGATLARLLLTLTTGRTTALPRVYATLLRAVSQRNSEAINAKARRQTLLSGDRFDKALAFAHPPD